MDDRKFRELLERFGYCWQGYRKVRKGVKKRIVRHMHRLGMTQLDDYMQAVRTDPEVRSQFNLLITVSISRFFRDKRLWDDIKGSILPGLAQNKGVVKAWSAGCACGEEAYTLKMTWEAVKVSLRKKAELFLLATDINPEYLRRAREALYPSSSIKEVPPNMVRAFLEAREDKQFALKEYVKQGIHWRIHDLLEGAPVTELDLIFLRNNLLTYYGKEIKASAFRRILNDLNPGGFLIIGAHERLPGEFEELRRWHGRKYIFQKSVS